MHTSDIADENYRKLAALFPDAITETTDEDGNIVRAIDADVLMQEINRSVVKGDQQRYQFTWPDKRKALNLANTPTTKTLRFLKEKSVGRDGTPGGTDSENIYIEGDNLDALKILRETYLGKVKMIYIDPPYNTGHDFVYADDFSIKNEAYKAGSGQYDESGNRLVQNIESNGRFHTDWLNMIYPRIRLSKDLLSDDGFIAISMGEEETYNLQKICNEIFGEENFRNIIALRRYDKNLNLQFVDKGLPTLNVGLEYILIYSKSPNTKMTAIYQASDEDRGKWGYWKGFWNNADRPTMRYTLLGVTPKEGQWKWKKDLADDAVKNYEEYESKYKGKMSLEQYWVQTGRSKKFIRRNPNGKGKNMGVEHWIAPSDGKLRNSNWSDLLVSKVVGFDFPFDNPKNPEVIQELLKLFSVNSTDIVMDFFSGSATTAQATMQQNAEDTDNRRYIMVQIPAEIEVKSEAYAQGYKTICEIGEARIKSSAQKIKIDSKADIDYGFRCFKVDSSNMKNVYYIPSQYDQSLFERLADNIKEDRTPEDLLIQVMLDLGIELSFKVEKTNIEGKEVFSVADGYMLACFDKDVTDEVVKTIAERHPFYAVFRDNSMATDSVAVNFDQIFNTYSPKTIRKVL